MKAIPRSGRAKKGRRLEIDRSTGELKSDTLYGGKESHYSYYGKCESGLMSELPVEPIKERKF